MEFLRKDSYIYIGMDLHKATHTAVILNCWNEKLDVITIENKPSEFSNFARKINNKATRLGVTPIFGLENAYGYGRSLAVWLIEKGYIVKDINPALSYSQRKSAPMTQKNDEWDAECVATILLNQLQTLPNAIPEDKFWTLSRLVNRRDALVTDGIRLKNGLNEQVTPVYPSYHKFFCDVGQKTALYFWKTYPSPEHLQGKTVDEVWAELKEIAPQFAREKVEIIFESVQDDGQTSRSYQAERDFITQSLCRDLEHQTGEIAFINKALAEMLNQFDYQLLTFPGINVATASRIIAEIGDISRFPNADKLARFAGIAPTKFSSAGKGNEEATKQGNRKLHGVFYFLAVYVVGISPNGKIKNPIFYAYFQRKISQGKTKTQALICIMRRLVNIIYGMLKNKTAYIPPNIEDLATEK